MQQDTHPFYIGYGSADRLLAGVPTDTPLYLSVTNKPAGGPMGTRVWSCTLAYLGGGACHYLRFPFCSALEMHGQLAEPGAAERGRAKSAALLAVFTQYLAELGYRRVTEATIAVPRDLVLVEGGPGEWCHWDRETDTFSRRAAG